MELYNRIIIIKKIDKVRYNALEKIQSKNTKPKSYSENFGNADEMAAMH